MAIARMQSVVLDCPDPKRLADFYGTILGWETTSVEDDWVVVEGVGPERLCFQLARDYRRPEWPDGDRPQQFHLDLTVDDLARTETEILALGAVKHGHQPSESDSFRVYLDPAGHPFCLCAP
jgi:predicted enzyme related to lactoylglutathione lyase